MTEHSWNALVEHVRRMETLEGIIGTLGWDEQTMMPKAAASLRGAQQALLAGLAHEWVTDPRIEGWLADLEGSSDPVQIACRRNLGREHARQRRVPADLVNELALAKSEGFAAWIEAKQAADFERFAPSLEKLLSLSKRRVAAIDPDRHPYEVALEAFDPGTTVDSLKAMFTRLREGLTPLLDAIAAQPQQPALDRPFDAHAQVALHREVAAALGYDFDGGRLDHAEHPFTTGHGAGDVRITTHIEAEDLLRGLGGTIHETGHALYEQGLPHRHDGTTVAEAASFGLHESQSRFWENFIGRSEAFCEWLAGVVAKHFPDAGVDAEALYRASNRVERGLIRTAADEVTYNLHIIVRFELELALFEDRLTVRDLPEAWNERYREYLGVTPPDDGVGVLQDVHWSGAAFGYFPSYTLGNLYAASLGAVLEAERPSLWDAVRRGELGDVLAFLRERVHEKGHLEEAPDIVRAAVGERDHVEDLLGYLWGRHGALYGVERG
ncbi:MAG TPA: carboxypeptidase M32 [Sandaracinaceae bacterium LLY-WYZ-13_1]|nr:carboxypeptidase M32 [Sandaracinaceae bacterium LLY-WYZ-13_1]